MNNNNISIGKKGRRALTCAVFATMVLAAACVFAFVISDESSADAWYTFDEETGTMTVTGPTTGSIDYNMRSTIKKIVITNTVTQINNSTFSNCNNCTSLVFEEGSTLVTIGQYSFSNLKITEVTIPATVKTIDYGAFSGCQQMRAVHFESGSQLQTIGREAFNYCTSLGTMDTIPATVTSIGVNFINSTALSTVEFQSGINITNLEAVFSNATGLKTITIPNSVTSARGAFQNCTSLTTVNFGTGLTEIPQDMFYNCQSLKSVTIPNTVTSIGYRAFYNCGLQSITLNVDSLGTNVFANCANLKTVTFQKTFDTIPDYTFSGCTSLTTVNGLDDVTAFGSGVFQNCKSITSFRVPDGVTVLSPSLFYGAGLTSIDLNNVTEIGSSALGQTQLTSIDLGKVTKLGDGSLSGTKMTYVNLTGITDIGAVFSGSGDTLKKVVLDKSLTTLPSYMFSGCSGLTSVEYGDDIISFGARAFYGCTSLKEIHIPDSLQTIGGSCFYNCTSLETFVAKPNLNTMYSEMFNYCTSLRTIDLSASSITVLKSNTIQRCDSLTELLLPDTLVQIEERAITYCPSLRQLHIPSSVTTLSKMGGNSWSYYPFCDCALEEISGGEGITYINPTAFMSMSAEHINLDLQSMDGYDVIDGILCSEVAGGYRAILFPEVTGDYVMPDNIVSMEPKAMKLVSATSITFSPNMPVITIDISNEENKNDTLVKIVIPEGVVKLNGSNGSNSSIGGGAFDFCIALKEVQLPSTLLEIDGLAFRGCSSLETVTLPENLEQLGNGSYRGYVFDMCTSLKSINLPYNISTIERSTFSSCTSLESIDLSYVETINDYAFSGCKSMKEIKFGQYMNQLSNCFSGCDSLESVTLDGVDLRVTNSFTDCKSLKKVVLKETVKDIQNSFTNCPLETIEVAPENPYLMVSGGMLFSIDGTKILLMTTNIKDVVIPDTVTSIMMNRVSGDIRSVVFGSGLTNFEGSCRWFSGIKTLESVTIKNCQTRCVMCFDNCTSLKELNINEGATSVELEGCTALKALTLPSTITMLRFEKMDAPRITLSEGSETLAIEGNVIYNKDTEMVVAVLDPHSVVMPEGISWDWRLVAENITLGNGTPVLVDICLYGVKTVTFTEDVEYVGDWFFEDCYDLTDIYILGDDIEFGEYAFSGLPEEQEIRIHSNIAGEFLADCEGPTFIYETGTGVTVAYTADDHVQLTTYPPQMAAEGGSVSFDVSAEQGYVLAVSATGGTAALANGTCTVTGISADGTVITMTTTFIGIPTEKIELERYHLSVMFGDKIDIGFALTPFDSSDAVVWTTSDDSVVSITNDGIKAVGSGKATLTATSGTQTATCEVTVSAPEVGETEEKSMSVPITLGGCAAALVLVGVACLLIRRRV